MTRQIYRNYEIEALTLRRADGSVFIQASAWRLPNYINVYEEFLNPAKHSIRKVMRSLRAFVDNCHSQE